MIFPAGNRATVATFLSLSILAGQQLRAQSVPATSAPAFPEKDWQLVRPETDGYSSARLEALRAWLATGSTTAMVVIVHGHMIFSYGDTALVSKVASVRKSILSMLYGVHVDKYEAGQNQTV